MLALQKLHPKPGLSLSEVAEPRPAAGEVLIEVGAVGICGSDLHVDRWAPSYSFITPALPVTIGHEFAGRVVAVGASVSSELEGARVTVMPSVTCGRCGACLAGRFDDCRTRTGIGLTRPGAFARFVCAPAANCVVLPAALSDEMAALAEPFTVGAQALARARLNPGARVLVLGPGTIGQTIAVMARAAGASVVAVAGYDDMSRLAVVRALGFAHTVDLAHDDTSAWTQSLLGAHERFDVVFDAAGTASAIQTGLDLLSFGGALVSLGIPADAVPLDFARLVRNQQEVRGSHRAPREMWPKVVAFLAANAAALAPMITHRLRLSEVNAGFALGHARQASKVIVTPN